MKKYIFFTPTLSNMGGAQMYVRNKCLYLSENGWEVEVVAGEINNVVIPELKQYKVSYPVLLYPEYYFSTRIKKKIAQRIASVIMDSTYEAVVIESTSITCASWAETVAKMTGARHFVFLLQESNEIANKGMQNFFIFKHDRHEMAGIAKDSLRLLFNSFHPIPECESYRLAATCNNVEADVECPLIKTIDRNNYDFIIGMLSRLNKPFLLPATKHFVMYAKKRKDRKYLLLMIGDAPQGDNSPQEIKKIVSELANVELKITGYLYPVPTRLLELCDVFISSAGSSHPCKRSGVPTITYDSNDYLPIGVLGRTTKNTLFRDENEPPIELDELLDKILEEKLFPIHPAKYKTGIPVFVKHMNFLEQAEPTLSYFDINSICAESISERRTCFGLSFFGPVIYSWLHQIKAKFN